MNQVSNSANEDKIEKKPIIAVSVIVPVFNEEHSIKPFLNRLEPILQRIGNYQILFCLDPSFDNTEKIILEEIERNRQIGLLVFSRRFGQPSAVIAGIHQCSGETCVVIDVDLQDPPELIFELYQKLLEGYEVVYAQRRSRQGETVIKLGISWLGYKIINSVTPVKIPKNTGDFRIMSRRVLDELIKLKEGHGFLRGLVAFVGFRQTFIQYDRAPRLHGFGKYNRFLGSLKIGMNGLVGFSNFLLTLTLLVGIAVAGIGFLLAVGIVVTWYIGVVYPIGIPTLIVLVLFLGGIQLIGIGILGEYIGRIYDETKQRPTFIIDRSFNVDSS